MTKKICCALVLGLVACKDSSVDPAVYGPERAPSKVAGATAGDQESAFMAQINEYRPQVGASKLVRCASLDAAARRHALDMAAHGFVGHDGSDGSDFAERSCDAGYKLLCKPIKTTGGENALAGDSSAQDAFVSWKNSSGHDANMREKSFRVVGVARIADGPFATAYWVTVFGGDLHASCDASTPDEGPTPGPQPNGEPVPTPTKPEPGCQEGKRRCADAMTLEVCDEGGWKDHDCKALCAPDLASGCVYAKPDEQPVGYYCECHQSQPEPQPEPQPGPVVPAYTCGQNVCVDKLWMVWCGDDLANHLISCDDYCAKSGRTSAGCQTGGPGGEGCACEGQGKAMDCTPGERSCEGEWLRLCMSSGVWGGLLCADKCAPMVTVGCLWMDDAPGGPNFHCGCVP